MYILQMKEEKERGKRVTDGLLATLGKVPMQSLNSIN